MSRQRSKCYDEGGGYESTDFKTAMVAYVVDKDVQGLKTASSVTRADLDGLFDVRSFKAQLAHLATSFGTISFDPRFRAIAAAELLASKKEADSNHTLRAKLDSVGQAFDEKIRERVSKAKDQIEDGTGGENIQVRLTIVKDESVKSRICISHRFTDPDASPPRKKDKHSAQIEFTHRNTRGLSDVNTSPSSDTPSHRTIDVSSRACKPLLQKLYAHAVRKEDEIYFDALYACSEKCGHRLTLSVFEHNGQPCTSNLFTREERVPIDIDDLRIIMKQPALVCVLVLGTDVPAKVDKVFRHFRQLCHRDPLDVFYENRETSFLGVVNVKKTDDLPKFKRKARNMFEDWTEFERQIELGMFLEKRYQLEHHEYNGLAAVVPVPRTYNSENGLFEAYMVHFTPTKSSKMPDLTEGDIVQVEFPAEWPSLTIAGDTSRLWKGRVTGPSVGAGVNQISMSLRRPWNPQTKGFADAEEHSNITLKELESMKTSDFHTWVRSNCHVSIKVLRHIDGGEIVRLWDNLKSMRVSEDLSNEFSVKEDVLSELRNMILGKDHTIAKSSCLYAGIDPDFVTSGKQIVLGSLRPHQIDSIQTAINGQMYNKTIFLEGPSGSGKSTVAIITSLPYLGSVTVNQDIRAIFLKERELYLASLPDDADQNVSGMSLPSEDLQPGLQCDEETPHRPGCITYVAQQNATTDDLFVKCRPWLKNFEKQVGLEGRIVLRMHSLGGEIGAVKAMINPKYDRNKVASSARADTSGPVKGKVASAVREHYHKENNDDDNPGIPDRRIKHFEGSAARYILELARFPGYRYSDEIKATFSDKERDTLAEQLARIVEAHEALKKDNKMTKEISRVVEEAAKLGLQALLEKAAVVVTTAATATKPDFTMFRYTDLLVVDELGRCNDADVMGFFSRYWYSVRIFVGDGNQLDPMTFAPPGINPFEDQCRQSFLNRMKNSGLETSYLYETARFENEELLEICARANNLPNLRPMEGCYNSENTRKFSEIVEKCWGINHPVVIVEPERCDVSETESRRCVQTAQAALRTIVSACEGGLDGSRMAIISPYNAQVRLLVLMLASAVLNATRPELAASLKRVAILTCDSSMGQERSFVVLDTAGHPGHIFELPRTLVSLTRAKVAMVIIAPAKEWLDSRDPDLNRRYGRDHPLLVTLRDLRKKGRICRLTQKKLHSFPQYNDVLEAINLPITGDELTQFYFKNPSTDFLKAKHRDKDALEGVWTEANTVLVDEETKDLTDMLDKKFGGNSGGSSDGPFRFGNQFGAALKEDGDAHGTYTGENGFSGAWDDDEPAQPW